MKAYHMTPSKNVDSILADGIEPRDRASNESFQYSDKRVYLWAELFDLAIDGTLGEMFRLNGYEAYTMLEIDCDMLDESLFIKDDCMPGKLSVYTAQAVPAEVIKSIGNALNFA